MDAAYDALADRLETPRSVSLTALPDGSIDRYYRVLDRPAGHVASRAEFGRRLLAAETESFAVEHVDTDLGGQAVNAARQAAALDDSVTLLGFLDDERFDALDATTVSMGAPADIAVYEFTDMDLLLAERSDEMASWGVEEFRAHADPTVLDADAVFWGNWVSFDDTTTVLEWVAGLDLSGGPLVFDPGDVTTHEDEAVGDLLAALGDLEATHDVVLSTNRRETTHLAGVLGLDAPIQADAVAALREAVGITGVVLHDRSRAVAATPEGVVDVSSLEVSTPVRRTGGGDRFGAGVAHALALDWEWATALALGNLCASHYVATGETGDSDALRATLADHRSR